MGPYDKESLFISLPPPLPPRTACNWTVITPKLRPCRDAINDGKPELQTAFSSFDLRATTRKLFFKCDALMGNKEEQALSPAGATLTYIHPSACQPGSRQAVSQAAGAPHGRKPFQQFCRLHVSPLMAPFIKAASSRSARLPRRVYRLVACVSSQSRYTRVHLDTHTHTLTGRILPVAQLA